ncbi:MAG: PQQ-like beta-propeller repeat protein, partial [Planctomycetes bacterium]|nr:PQQ-like beta-propeller repeat protein [Planctomycetota bacterium]
MSTLMCLAVFLTLSGFKTNVILAQLANSPWPMLQHDPQHTSRSHYQGPQSGYVKWSFVIGERVVLSSPSIGPDGAIYFGSHSGTIYAVEPTGTLRWTYQTGGPVETTPAISAKGTIYVGSGDGKLYAIKPEGKLEFTFETTSPIDSSPTISPDGSICFGSGNGKLYSITKFG